MTIRKLLYPLLTFCGILMTAMFWVHVLDIEAALESTGLKLHHWLLIDILWTLSGGLVCWALSRDMSLWATSSLLFEPTDEVEFTQRVHDLGKSLGLLHPLQIASYPSPEINLFIAGPTEKRSVLSVSKGFLALSADQQIRLLTPEILKLKNGSNNLLIVCQGMTYGFNLYLARVVALLLGTSLLSSEGETSSTKAEVIVSIVTTTFLTFFGSLVLGHLSRERQLLGDQAAAREMGGTKVKDIIQFWKEKAAGLEQNDVFTSTLKAGGQEARWKGPFTTRSAYKKRLDRVADSVA